MTNIDNMLKKVLGKGKAKRQSFGNNINKILGKSTKTSFGKTTFGVKSILGKPILKSRKGASPFMQQKWKSFSPNFKKILRKRLPDTDGDRVPDMFDCAPRNIFRQDDKKDDNLFDSWPPQFEQFIPDPKEEVDDFLGIENVIGLRFNSIGPGLLLASRYTDNESGVSSDNSFSPRGSFILNKGNYIDGWLTIYAEEDNTGKTEAYFNKKDLPAFKTILTHIFNKPKRPNIIEILAEIKTNKMLSGEISYLDIVAKYEGN